jgi:hypothetical protein
MRGRLRQGLTVMIGVQHRQPRDQRQLGPCLRECTRIRQRRGRNNKHHIAQCIHPQRIFGQSGLIHIERGGQIVRQRHLTKVTGWKQLDLIGLKTAHTQPIGQRWQHNSITRHLCQMRVSYRRWPVHGKKMERRDHAITAREARRILRAKRSIAAIRTATPISTCS